MDDEELAERLTQDAHGEAEERVGRETGDADLEEQGKRDIEEAGLHRRRAGFPPVADS
ncbi:MAG: hypothetical protein JWM48_355 [Mycobacterium sp.]|jgi:uncharacterized protein YjbJ (UPF0337 family)|nr:hypothetical protein [Mycobacterium sp.]MCW2743805.1 hypothetical protein [Mycobacterium sp.]